MQPVAHPQSPDVAVIIAAFNAAGFLDQTLATVAGQTQPPAVVVVADDCSTDDTAERALAWKSRLPIHLVRLDENVGPGPARHRAILTTDVPLLALLDADDLLLPDHLETMRAAYEQAPGLVSAQELAWIPGRGIDLVARRARPRPVPADQTEQLVRLLQHNYMNFPLFSRELYDRAGGFRQQFLVGEDWDLWIRMLRTGARVTETTHPTALHRVRSDSLTLDIDRNLGFSITVLTAAVKEAGSPLERRAAERGRRRLLARQAYRRAQALAGNGKRWRAQLEAARGLRSLDRRATLGLAAMALAPRTWLRLEQATRHYRTFHPH